ncbi:hypothetical protein D3C85_849550 [compost metagenome]
MAEARWRARPTWVCWVSARSKTSPSAWSATPPRPLRISRRAPWAMCCSTIRRCASRPVSATSPRCSPSAACRCKPMTLPSTACTACCHGRSSLPRLWSESNCSKGPMLSSTALRRAAAASAAASTWCQSAPTIRQPAPSPWITPAIHRSAAIWIWASASARTTASGRGSTWPSTMGKRQSMTSRNTHRWSPSPWITAASACACPPTWAIRNCSSTTAARWCTRSAPRSRTHRRPRTTTPRTGPGRNSKTPTAWSTASTT